jgi:translocation and assembly module TamB
LTGEVNAETTLRGYASGVTPESIDVAGQLTLGPSRVGDISIDSASIDGRYANREGQLNQAVVTGADVSLTAQGPIALNETGSSNLTVHAESTAIDRVGEIIGQPLKGSAIVDATVTGNARELTAKGTLTGSNVGHGDNEALSLNSEFTVSVPDLTPADTRVQATSVATFVEIRGQRINELKAATTYASSRLEFDAVAQQGMRELAAAGDLVLHPDHQEVHLGALALRSEQIEWRSEPGSPAAIQYGGGRIAVQGLRLVSGEQRIQADGVVGSPSEALRVHAENVDVAQVDALFLGDQRLAGRFTGDATITGTTDDPHVSATFSLNQGAFQAFKYESLTGMVDYAGRDVTLDVRLQQTPTAWLTAKGRAPMSLFRPNQPSVADAPDPDAGGTVDIAIASSEVDLGIVQGFTTYVTDVTGTMQANVRLTGTGNDPHVDGTIDIRGGAFAVPDLGTNYTGLETRIDLKPDVVSIQEFKILDNRGFPMTVGGTLAVHDRSVGAVNVTVQSENFEVIDNEFADLKLDTDLRITGELLKPRIAGSVEVENGTVFVARVMEAATADPYATEATVVPEKTVQADAGSRLFDGVELDVALAIPSNLVLSGNDLRPANAPIEIGDVNVTVGGALQVRKAPGAEARVTGEVNTIRGNYTFQGRRFDIVRDGRIRFAGTDVIDPSLDIRASRLISGVETVVRVQGTMRQPELSFSSNPPLDQADILSLIVFNQPINELGEGQQATLAERATALAGGYLASGLTQAIGGALELDEFEIQASGERGFGPSLTVGEQVGEHFFFRIRQGFGDAQATELILEYQLKDFLRLQGTAAETSGGSQRVTFRRVERAGIDLIFFFSF